MGNRFPVHFIMFGHRSPSTMSSLPSTSAALLAVAAQLDNFDGRPRPPMGTTSDFNAHHTETGKRSKCQRQRKTEDGSITSLQCRLCALAVRAEYSAISEIIAAHDRCFSNIETPAVMMKALRQKCENLVHSLDRQRIQVVSPGLLQGVMRLS